ncbi:free fatty acid receptor 3 [Ictalurus punctatus]|uniref:Free fatty acid receptor 3 n=1 Tax=Ictalurus punctatus TaxID=7998 RepID=A0A2D0PTH1_ICTPU|nr:free fatty acid receptor 3 [Ictalurus punctatus]XP_017309313.1 free fatty acid receptor 3 [Ictalurus punctatus]
MYWTKTLSNLVLTVDSITQIIGLPANLLALYTFIQKIKQQAKPLDILLLNLNISDLLVHIFLPLRMKEAADMKWTVSYFLCPLMEYVIYTTIYNSTLLLTAISVERYLGVAFPIKYKQYHNSRNAVIAVVLFWVVTMAHCSFVYIVKQYESECVSNGTHQVPVTRDSCYMMFNDKQLEIILPFRLELFIVLFCIPFIICSFCYIKLILILSRLHNINYKRRRRAIGLALVTFLLFTICFMPFNVSHLVGFIGWHSPSWSVYTLLPITFNACVDPLIFYFSSSMLRQTFAKFVAGLIKRLEVFCFWRLFKSSTVKERLQNSQHFTV